MLSNEGRGGALSLTAADSAVRTALASGSSTWAPAWACVGRSSASGLARSAFNIALAAMARRALPVRESAGLVRQPPCFALR